MNNKSIYSIALLLLIAAGMGCQKGDLLSNPNAASESNTIPVSLILNHITYSMYAGGGVMDGRQGSVNESPWDQEFIWSQYFVSNYQYYRGNNAYNWSYSATTYDMLKYTIKLEEQAQKQYGNTTNFYFGMAKFFRAYAFIWLTQRVGDIPMSEAGDPANLTPKYDTQKEVYRKCLALLDSANTIMGSPANAAFKLDANGDVFGLTTLQWQKVVNTYKLRVLISLSKRADDNADLNIKQQFAAILADPIKYPVMTSNTDNMVFIYNSAYNSYPIFSRGNAPYNKYANIGKTYLDITTATNDPRTFIAATPAPAQLASGKGINDFSAYVGADINLDLATLNTKSDQGQYSYANYLRYYSSSAGVNAEPYILIGYSEMCFSIAEGINRGWAAGSASSWYYKGINASLSLYGFVSFPIFRTVED